MTPERFSELALAIEKELGRVMVGQREVIRLVLMAMIAGGHVLLEGVPGLGKTVLVRSLGGVLHLEFARVQFTPDLMPADITGTHIVTEDERGRRRFEFQAGPLFTNLLLADEINRATPKTQSALLEAMQERQVTVGDRTRPLPDPFFVLATQNPIELEGTYPLPEAQLDRFFFKILVQFPDAADLAEIARRTTGTDEAELHPVASGAELAQMALLAREVPIAEHVLERGWRPCWRRIPIRQPHPSRSSATCAGDPRPAACRHWSWAPASAPCWTAASTWRWKTWRPWPRPRSGTASSSISRPTPPASPPTRWWPRCSRRPADAHHRPMGAHAGR